MYQGLEGWLSRMVKSTGCFSRGLGLVPGPHTVVPVPGDHPLFGSAGIAYLHGTDIQGAKTPIYL